MEWIRPEKLKVGDGVGVVAPAGAVDPVSLEKGLDIIRQIGFDPVLGDSLKKKYRLMAGSDEERVADLVKIIRNPDVKAVFCARGGYGVNRILPLLEPRLFRKYPKIIVGSSDITLLLWYLNRKCSMTAFHGPMVAGSFGRCPMPASEKQFKALLMGKASARKLKTPLAQVVRPGKGEGTLAGGCLTLLCRSLGTPYEIETRDTILLIEDVQEPIYRIDGMLWQLRVAGKFKEVRGVVLGEMIKCHPPGSSGFTLSEVFADFFKDDDFPVLWNCPVGHGNEIWTIPLGSKALLDTKTRSLTLADCGVV